MIKKLSLLIAAVLLLSCLLSVSAYAIAEEDAQLVHITDMYNLLSDSEKSDLETRAASVSTGYQCSVYVVIVDDFTKYASSNDVYVAGTQIYDNYVLGYGEYHDGVLLLLSMNERDFSLVAGGKKGNEYFNNAGMTRLEDAFLDNFRNNDWYGGFCDYISACEKILQSEPESSSYVNPGVTAHNYDSSGNYDYSDVTPQQEKNGISAFEGIVSAVVSFITGLGTCSVMKKKMKTANLNTTAEKYVDTSSARFTNRSESFIRRTEQRQIIPQNQPSSGGGMSRPSGGGHSIGHSGHSGKF